MDCPLSPDELKPRRTRLMTWPEFANGGRHASRPVGIDRRSAKTQASAKKKRRG
jgi:hypothetical protein